MRIANYLRPDCVALRQRADSLTGAVQQMVILLDGTDNLTDTAVFAADVRARLALGGVCADADIRSDGFATASYHYAEWRSLVCG